MATDTAVNMTKLGQMLGDRNGSIETWSASRTDENGVVDHHLKGPTFDYRIKGVSLTLVAVATEIAAGIANSLGFYGIQQPESANRVLEAIPQEHTEVAAANHVIMWVPEFDVVVEGRRGGFLRYQNAEIDIDATPTMDMFYRVYLQRV